MSPTFTKPLKKLRENAAGISAGKVGKADIIRSRKPELSRSFRKPELSLSFT
jgi:hypothetical protein